MGARIVHNSTETSVSIYSTGPLDVSDLTEVVIDIDVTFAAGGTPYTGDWGGYTHESVDFLFVVSRLSAFDTLTEVGRIFYHSEYNSNQEPPGELVYPSGGNALILSSGFGNRLQLDLLNDEGISLTFRLSIIGK
jgi:hypothetical protein